jgi:hypothetical protein
MGQWKNQETVRIETICVSCWKFFFKKIVIDRTIPTICGNLLVPINNPTQMVASVLLAKAGLNKSLIFLILLFL